MVRYEPKLSLKELCEVGALSVSALQMRKLRHAEVIFMRSSNKSQVQDSDVGLTPMTVWWPRV